MIWVVGLSHRTAPIELRERAALDDETSAAKLRELVGSGVIAEAMILSTCNRMELYFVTGSGQALASSGDSRPVERASERDSLVDGQAVEAVLEALKLSASDVGKHVFLHRDRDALRHLFRVAASLDSLVVGEPQILGQLKRGYEKARALGVIGPSLNRAAMRAFRTAKRVRSETTIGAGQVSVATVALDLARQIFDQLSGRTVALIGAGEMGEAIAQLFQQAGAKLVLLGRNAQRVAALAQRVGAEGRLMAELERTLTEACVVVTSTSATLPVVGYDLVKSAMRRRRGRELFFVDVAVPRDVEGRVGTLDGVYLYNVDDLSSVVAGSHASRQDGAVQAEAIVESELVQLGRREEAEQVTPIVRALYAQFGRVLRAEVDRSLHGSLLTLGADEKQGLERMVGAATKKLLHQPATTLKRWAVERPEELESALELLHEMLLPQGVDATSGLHEGAPRSSPVGKNTLPSRSQGPGDGTTAEENR